MTAQAGPPTVAPSTAETVLAASRALLGVVARSLAPALEQVSLVQFRVLVVLWEAGGAMRSGALAAALGVHPSTLSRTADRLERAGWVRRVPNPASRRETLVELSGDGRRLVSVVLRRRVRDVERILSAASTEDHARIVAGLDAVARSAGEPEPGDLARLGM